MCGTYFKIFIDFIDFIDGLMFKIDALFYTLVFKFIKYFLGVVPNFFLKAAIK
jgi:hypothetical protein